MNINIASHYMRSGYRIRRSDWPTKTYMSANSCGDVDIVEEFVSYTLTKDKSGKSACIEHKSMQSFSNLKLEDFLADDWEIITTGIRKHYNKKYGQLEYDDDTDWDNYVHVPSKGGWFDDEDEDS